jgi:hypothetical protein
LPNLSTSAGYRSDTTEATRGSILARSARLRPHSGKGTSLGQSFGKLSPTLLLYASKFLILVYTVFASNLQIFSLNIKCFITVGGTDKFYLSLLGWSLTMMHVIDVLLDSFTRVFRYHRYSPLEKLFILWALERLGMTYFHETFGDRNKIERWFSTTTSTRRL